MKTISIIILILSLAFGLFGCWGMFTQAGMKEYTEMAGLLPYFALLAGIILFIAFLILLLVSTIIKKRRRAK